MGIDGAGIGLADWYGVGVVDWFGLQVPDQPQRIPHRNAMIAYKPIARL